jgi:hypothetical protein
MLTSSTAFAASSVHEFSLPSIDVTGNSRSVVGNYNFFGAGGTDTFTLTGTNSNDQFNFFGGASAGITHLVNGVLTNFLALSNFTTVIVDSLDGDDVFNVPGNFPFALNLNGGNPSASDVVTFTTVGAGAVTVDLAAQTVQQAGFGLVSLTGVEVLNVNAVANAITVNGTANPDALAVTPTGTNTATITSAGLNLTVNTNNTAALNINGNGGSDTLTVNGTQSGETITVSATQVTVTGLKAVTYSNTENLVVNGQAGSDMFNVTPSATTAISIDGGDPIGVVGDTLTVTVPVAAGATTFRAGPEGDEGGFSFAAGGIQAVSFDHVEVVGPINVAASGGVVNIVATNADNDINILGIDPDSLSVSIDGGPAIRYDGVTTLNVDALAGDDDISITSGPFTGVINITTPAPREIVGTKVTVGGGGLGTARTDLRHPPCSQPVVPPDL